MSVALAIKLVASFQLVNLARHSVSMVTGQRKQEGVSSECSIKCMILVNGHRNSQSKKWVYGFGGLERWNGMVEWTGMEWNGQINLVVVGVFDLCP